MLHTSGSVIMIDIKRLIGICLLVTFSYLSLASNEYEIVYPERVDTRRSKRDLSTKLDDVLHEDNAMFELSTKKGDFHLNVKKSKGFHSDKILLRTFDDNGVGVHDQHTPENCFYHGKIADNEKSDVLLSTCNGLRGHVDDGMHVYHIEPVESREDEGAHKFYMAPPEIQDDERMESVNLHDDYIESDDDMDEDDAKLVQRTVSLKDPTVYSKLSKIPGVESQYIKYLTTSETRYCEIYLVVDNAIYQKYGKDKKVVTERMLNLIHAVHRSYAAININLVLVALEIWTDKNKIDYETSGGAQISKFNQYRRKHIVGLVEHDIAHYMSIRGWSGRVIGMAYLRAMCSNWIGTAINKWNFNSITGPNVVFGHELGHNFDFPHDGKDCTCLTARGCFMGGYKTRRPGFTDCNLKRLARNAFSCLNNYPKGPMGKKCGNGIKEGDEECDCGTPENCKKNDPCCQPNGCKLKRSSQCSEVGGGQVCCKNCLFKKQGALCRASKGLCDLPEYCTGDSSTCPADLSKKDGTPCRNHASIIHGNVNSYREKEIRLNPSIKARYLRFNPVYKAGTYYCLKLELLTCTADEDTTNQVTPISTLDLYYTSSVCLIPASDNCSESISRDPGLIFKKQSYGDCNKPNMLFRLEKDGTLRHNCSGKIVCPDSSNDLYLKKECSNDKGKYERLANYGLRHKASGYCVEQYNKWPGWPDGGKVKLRGTKDCDGSRSRTKLLFLEQDCLLPIGMENGKLPNSAFKSSFKIHRYYEAHEARVQSGKGWCLDKTAGKKEYLEIDMGKVKTVSGFKMQGATGDWATALKLYYSDDGVLWHSYKSTGDPHSESKDYCYLGKCGTTSNSQCKDLWDPAAITAGKNCWEKLNTEAAGYGTCDPSQNKTCSKSNIFCGQLQCASKKDKPSHINYGTKYAKFNASGDICSGASITIQGSSKNDQEGLGMVQDGTKCGHNKMCVSHECKSFAELKIKECGTSGNLTCAGRGSCDNKGRCHCDRGYDPNTNCTQPLIQIDGSWGQWREWSACTHACNGGKRHRSRFCDTPFPAHGGADCPGQRLQEEKCNTDACPRATSCKDLMLKLKSSGKSQVDGVYDIHLEDKTLMKMYCDMTRDGGGWTLVVSSHTNNWTSSDMVRERNIDKPDLLKDYSMLRFADRLKDNYLIGSNNFEFKIEAQNRGHWGGIWKAPSYYRIDSTSSSQRDIHLIKRFDNWNYHSYGVESILPFVKGNSLTMNDRNKWGSITGNWNGYHPAPWMSGPLKESEPEHIWYWMREGDMAFPTSCMEIKVRGFSKGQVFKSGKYTLKNEKGNKISAFCDMDSFGGGWTLMVNKISGSGWTKATTLSRNVDKASLSEEYSILSYSKAIMRLQKEESTFQYMIEADGEKRWGGIFEGSIKDGLTSCTPSAKKPKLLKKFDNWDESTSSFLKSNPYVVDNLGSLLTTSLKPTEDKADGILVSQTKSIYMKSVKESPKFVRLWMREGVSYKSCNQLKTIGQRSGGIYKNGFYNMRGTNGNIRTVYCDMESDPGAWTLLVTSANGNWTRAQVKSRNEDKPSIINDYSILHLADSIKGLSNNDTFRYKLDARNFNRWGGVWEAPKKYTFLYDKYNQEKVKLLKQFDKWNYNVWHSTVNNRMPWLGKKKGILTTSGTSDHAWWGTIISDNLEYKPAPWIRSVMVNPGVIWYWVNEDDCSADRKRVDGGMTPWSMWTPCSVVCGQGVQSRFRKCSAPKPRCGGSLCDGYTKQQQKCTGKCEVSPIKSFDNLYCILPQNGGCNVTDNTQLIWKYGLNNCDLPEAQFIFDKSSGSLTHKCSGKPACPKDGSTAHYIPLVLSSTCPKMQLTRHFMRTLVESLNFGGKCFHPNGGQLKNNVALILWHGCFPHKTYQKFFKLASGPVRTNYWSSVNVKTWKISDLTSDVRFPNNPTFKGHLDNFDSPYDMGNYYGIQMTSYFVAPETGLYTFQAACDDVCQIFLSNSSSAQYKESIIHVPGWTSQYQYDKRSSQTSKPIYLEVGKKYYIEGLVVEGAGGDHLSVAVTFPSGLKSKPLDGYYLRANAD